MKLGISCDIDWESKVDKVVDDLSSTEYRSFFEQKNYGSSIDQAGLPSCS